MTLSQICDKISRLLNFTGRTKEEAFRIGEEMADEVTKLNPKPVKLKFEKVAINFFLIFEIIKR